MADLNSPLLLAIVFGGLISLSWAAQKQSYPSDTVFADEITRSVGLGYGTNQTPSCHVGSPLIESSRFTKIGAPMMVFPGLPITCYGEITEWLFMPSHYNVTRLHFAVFRPTMAKNRHNEYRLVSMNIPSSDLVVPGTWNRWAVPPQYRIAVQPNDIIGIFYDEYEKSDTKSGVPETLINLATPTVQESMVNNLDAFIANLTYSQVLLKHDGLLDFSTLAQFAPLHGVPAFRATIEPTSPDVTDNGHHLANSHNCIAGSPLIEKSRFTYSSAPMIVFPGLSITCYGEIADWFFVPSHYNVARLYFGVFRPIMGSENLKQHLYRLIGTNMPSSNLTVVLSGQWNQWIVPPQYRIAVQPNDIIGVLYDDYDKSKMKGLPETLIDLAMPSEEERQENNFDAFIANLSYPQIVQRYDGLLHFAALAQYVRNYGIPAFRASITPILTGSGITPSQTISRRMELQAAKPMAEKMTVSWSNSASRTTTVRSNAVSVITAPPRITTRSLRKRKRTPRARPKIATSTLRLRRTARTTTEVSAAPITSVAPTRRLETVTGKVTSGQRPKAFSVTAECEPTPTCLAGSPPTIDGSQFKHLAAPMMVFPGLPILCYGEITEWAFVPSHWNVTGLYFAVFRQTMLKNRYAIIGVNQPSPPAALGEQFEADKWNNWTVPPAKRILVQPYDVIGVFYAKQRIRNAVPQSRINIATPDATQKDSNTWDAFISDLSWPDVFERYTGMLDFATVGRWMQNYGMPGFRAIITPVDSSTLVDARTGCKIFRTFPPLPSTESITTTEDPDLVDLRLPEERCRRLPAPRDSKMPYNCRLETFLRFYFSQTLKTCVYFKYTTCVDEQSGNLLAPIQTGNNFDSASQCLAACATFADPNVQPILPGSDQEDF